MALNVTDPWFVSNIDFNSEDKKLNIDIDFKKGSTFSYEYIETEIKNRKVTVDGIETDEEYKVEISRETFSDLKAYDTVNKTWRHLNFFEHPKSTSSLRSQRTNAISKQESLE